METEEALRLAKGLADIIMGFEPEKIEAILLDKTVLGAILYASNLDGPDADQVGLWAAYEVRRRYHEAAQARALPLLRTFLTREQRTDLRRHICFKIIGSAGGHYRLCPHGSRIARMVRRGHRDFDAVVYCYHDEGSLLPAADVMLGVMLLLMTDEPRFLAEANATIDSRPGRRRLAEEAGIV